MREEEGPELYCPLEEVEVLRIHSLCLVVEEEQLCPV